MQIIREPISRSELEVIAEQGFGDMVRAVVDVTRHLLAVGGELHSDEEAALLDDGSRQQDLWGINLYLEESQDDWIEHDSVINLPPSFGNRSRGVEDAACASKSGTSSSHWWWSEWKRGLQPTQALRPAVGRR